MSIEFKIIREILTAGTAKREGYSLGRLSCDDVEIGMTVEDEDRYLEEGNNVKVYGKTAMPLGRYKLTLYNSPKHGLVPLFHDVPEFTYTEMHRANHAEELLGCVGVGRYRTEDGVRDCQVTLDKVIALMQAAAHDGDECWCTIERKP